MYTKILYNNDSTFDYWYIDLITRTEGEFNSISAFLEEELGCYGIHPVGCPEETEESFQDSFAIEKQELSKTEYLKEFRLAVKKYKKQLKK